MRNDLRDARIKKGLTQQAVADAIGRDQGAVSRYESGKLAIDKDIAPKIAATLDIPVLLVLYPELAQQEAA